MQKDQINGILCPSCGVMFFAAAEGVFETCPVCKHRFKVRVAELIEATLAAE